MEKMAIITVILYVVLCSFTISTYLAGSPLLKKTQVISTLPITEGSSTMRELADPPCSGIYLYLYTLLIIVNALCNINDIYLGEIAYLEPMVRVYAVCIADRNV